MAKSLREVSDIAREFEKRFNVTASVAKKRFCDPNCPEDEKDDYCIKINLFVKKIPKELPKTFQGIPVFVRVLGPIRP